MLDSIAAKLRPWHAIAAWIVAIVLGVFLAAAGVAWVRNAAGGLDPLGLRFGGYSPAEAAALLAALGDSGRATYRAVVLLDLLFPPALVLALAALFIRLTQPGRRLAVPLPDAIRAVVLALALIGGVADWGENIVALVMLGGPGEPAALLAGLGSTFTGVKTYAYTLAALAVLVTLVLAVIRGLAGSRRSA